MYAYIQQPPLYPAKPAIIANGQSFSYQELHDASRQFAHVLLDNQTDLAEARVAFMVVPGFDYVWVQWGIWLAGGVAVPLATTYPLESLQYVIDDTQATIVVVSPEFEAILSEYVAEKGLRFLVLAPGSSSPRQTSPLPVLDADRRAMILYTSGTTSKPKGVISTHETIDAQVAVLLRAWAYADTDISLCLLPLHHVHGIINVVCGTLRAGGTVEFQPSFSAERVCDWFRAVAGSERTGVFMAVPTIYYKLIAHLETLADDRKKALKEAMTTFRLMISGSAALPVSIMETWQVLSGHRLLERYGMTEIGMAISNPYAGERRAGHIGQPLPGVLVRLTDEQDKEVEPGEVGEIQVRGKTVFATYWQRPEATEATFTADGWFRTGDVAVLDNGYYKILGRSSVDIIKSGGYKLSALEIEEVLRSHPQIADCSVVGLASDEWGELVAAALVAADPAVIDTAELNAWMRTRMPAYKVPRRYITLPELPRNAMGKVIKNELKTLF